MFYSIFIASGQQGYNLRNQAGGLDGNSSGFVLFLKIYSPYKMQQILYYFYYVVFCR